MILQNILDLGKSAGPAYISSISQFSFHLTATISLQFYECVRKILTTRPPESYSSVIVHLASVI